MTAEEKRDRRQARHEVQAALKRVAIRKLGFYSTGPQIRHGLRVLTDGYFAQIIVPVAQQIEREVLATHER